MLNDPNTESDAKDPREAILLVANKHDDTLCFIDPITEEILDTIPTGPNPHEIIVTPDQRFAYLSNYASPGNTISVIDLVQRKHIKQVTLTMLCLNIRSIYKLSPMILASIKKG